MALIVGHQDAGLGALHCGHPNQSRGDHRSSNPMPKPAASRTTITTAPGTNKGSPMNINRAVAAGD